MTSGRSLSLSGTQFSHLCKCNTFRLPLGSYSASSGLILEVKEVKKGGHTTVSDTGRGGQRRADCHEPGQGAS